MTSIWVAEIHAPTQVEADTNFSVDLDIKYRTLPWWLGGKLFTIFSAINKDNVLISKHRTFFRPWWFWGTKHHTHDIPGVSGVKSATYFGGVGYSD